MIQYPKSKVQQSIYGLVTRNIFAQLILLLACLDTCVQGKNQLTINKKGHSYAKDQIAHIKDQGVRNMNTLSSQSPCSCLPSEFTFELSFSQSCNSNDISVGPATGVEYIYCWVGTNSPTPNTDLVPVEVVSILIFETDQHSTVISQFSPDTDGIFRDGDIFQHVSITASTSWNSSADIPGGLHMTIKGKNNVGDELTNQVSLKYTNLCDVEPFRISEKLGWITFTDLGPPGKCTGVSHSSSKTPTLYPSTYLSTVVPTNVPSTNPPSAMPTNAPSTNPPSAMPTNAPSTNPPSAVPTNAPSTYRPSAEPTESTESVLSRIKNGARCRKFTANLDSQQEIPALDIAGFQGFCEGLLRLNVEKDRLFYKIGCRESLSGLPDAAHIHRGTVGVNGEVVVPLDVIGTTLGRVAEGNIEASDIGDDEFENLIALLFSGGAYFNVHTPKSPPGEVRGQIIPPPDCLSE